VQRPATGRGGDGPGYVVAENRDPKTTRVQEAMTPKAVYGYEDQAIEEAAKVMQEEQIRRLPVINREKHLVGIVSLGDLALKTGGIRAQR